MSTPPRKRQLARALRPESLLTSDLGLSSLRLNLSQTPPSSPRTEQKPSDVLKMPSSPSKAVKGFFKNCQKLFLQTESDSQFCHASAKDEIRPNNSSSSGRAGRIIDDHSSKSRPDSAPASRLPRSSPSSRVASTVPPSELETIGEEEESSATDELFQNDISAPVSPLPGSTFSRRVVSVPPGLETIPECQPETTDEEEFEQALNEIRPTSAVSYLGIEQPSQRRAGVIRPGFEINCSCGTPSRPRAEASGYLPAPKSSPQYLLDDSRIILLGPDSRPATAFSDSPTSLCELREDATWQDSQMGFPPHSATSDKFSDFHPHTPTSSRPCSPTSSASSQTDSEIVRPCSRMGFTTSSAWEDEDSDCDTAESPTPRPFYARQEDDQDRTRNGSCMDLAADQIIPPHPSCLPSSSHTDLTY